MIEGGKMLDLKMKNISVLIKPASSNCNIKCEYCFYYDESANREVFDYGFISISTIDIFLMKIFNLVTESVSFLFQGGEPMLIGIEFYKVFEKIVKKYNKNKIKVNYSIQTNGILLNQEWAEYFYSSNYLVGVSLDGIKNTHDKYRMDKNKSGTFEKVLDAIDLLKKNKVQFNILTVVTNEIVDSVSEIYKFYKDSDFYYMQFTPSIEPIKKVGQYQYMDTKHFGQFLDELFNLWYEDIKNKNYYSIRYFENLIMILMGITPESCDAQGKCDITLVMEADGSIYPCDFYILDTWRLGNINNNALEDIILSKKSKEFIISSINIPEQCKSCEYLLICRNGCRRYRNNENLNIYCESYYYFFKRNYGKLVELKDIILKERKVKAN